MTNPLTWLSRRRFPYEPLIDVEISRERLLHNLAEFRKLAPHGSVAPVLKSNAYGHGLLEVASILERYRRAHPELKNAGDHPGGIPFFVVDSYFEAVALRAAGVHTPLLIIGYTRPETMLDSHLRNTAFTVGSLEMLEQLENIMHPVRIHLKIDTGMRRQGILPDEIDMAMSHIAENPLVELEGICSHLFDADDADPSHTEGQINIWNKAVKKFKDKFASLKYMHLSASDGHRYTGDIDANVSRLGIGLYGLMDGAVFAAALDLKPVLSMRTIVTGTKKIRRDETIGYGAAFEADRDMTVATIPVGYFEGIDRRLSNVGTIGISSSNVACPIVGRVSMNITIVDVSDVPEVKAGTKAIVISNDPQASNSLLNMARQCGTITYELVVHIPSQLKRTVVE